MINTVRMPQKKLTLTFKDQWINDVVGKIILENRLIRYKKNFTKAVFYPEMGENTNFHYHGIITYKPEEELSYKSFIGGWRRYVGMIKISDPKETFSSKNKHHLIEWLMYCQKDQWLWNHKRIELKDSKRKTKLDHICNTCKCIKHKYKQKTIFDWWIT